MSTKKPTDGTVKVRPKKQRSDVAQAAWNRNSAGPMKDKRTPRKQTRNWRKDYAEE